MKIEKVDLHYLWVPYVPPVDPYWGWQAPCHGAHAVLVQVETEDGLVGWGETAGREKEHHHSTVAGRIEGEDATRVEGLVAKLKAEGHTGTAVSGIEMALWDLAGKRDGRPFHSYFGEKQRERVPLCGLMGIKPPEEAAATAREYVHKHGFRSIKTKVGRDPEEDATIALALHEAVGGEARFRFDANQAYSKESFFKIAQTFRKVNVEYIEQPFAEDDLDAHAVARKETNLPIALNESVGGPESVEEIAGKGAADVLVVDIPEAGGVLDLARVVKTAHELGLACAFHNWHDLGVKTAAMVHLASALPGFTHASDTTYHGLTKDVLKKPFEIEDGCIDVPAGAGLGVEVDLDVVDRWRKPEVD